MIFLAVSTIIIYNHGKSLAVLWGCLSGSWSLVVGFVTEKVAMGSPRALLNFVFEAFFDFQRRFFDPRKAKHSSYAVLFFASGARGTFFAGVSSYLLENSSCSWDRCSDFSGIQSGKPCSGEILGCNLCSWTQKHEFTSKYGYG